MRKFWRALALSAAIVPVAHAQTWPNQPITIIVPFPAGGSTDALMRLVAQPMGKALQQTVVIENVGGASGAIGAARASRSTPDGLTLFAGSINEVVLQPLVNPNVLYATSDFTPISLGVTTPLMLVGRQDLPQKNIDEVVETLKKAPDSLSFGSPGQGTFQHLVMEDIQQRTQIRMLHVPYKGAAPLINDVLGGQVDMAVMAPSTALPHVNQGNLKMLAVINPTRLAAYPDMPSINESQSIKDMNTLAWIGLLAPKGVPEDRLQRVRGAFAQALQQPEIRQRIIQMGMEPADSFDGESAIKRIAEDGKAMGLLISNLKP